MVDISTVLPPALQNELGPLFHKDMRTCFSSVQVGLFSFDPHGADSNPLSTVSGCFRTFQQNAFHVACALQDIVRQWDVENSKEKGV